MRKKYLILNLFVGISIALSAQERVVKVDFESGSFKNHPAIPYDQPFLIEGEVYKDVEYVKVEILDEGGSKALHAYSWNRDGRNQTETFSILIPGVLASNNKYDFNIITYKALSDSQKKRLKESIEQRVMFYMQNSYKFDGKNVSVNNPNRVYKGLKALIDDALAYQVSKNNIAYTAPSRLILDELKKNQDFRFGLFLRKTDTFERDTIANNLIAEKVQHITSMVMSEIMPYLNTALVQQYRSVTVSSVSTDKTPFTLPINVGLYAWNMDIIDGGKTLYNTNFTPGAGITVPLCKRTLNKGQFRALDSFGISLGVLFKPVKDAAGTEFVTPWVNLPVYTALGVRLFRVTRLNAGVLVVGGKGVDGVNKLNVVPTVGLALELDLWLGIKK